MKLTFAQLNEIAGNKQCQGRRKAFCEFLNRNAPDSFMRPHRLAQVVAQVMHECSGFRYTKEVWGPTKAQRGYEGRLDLGNTQKGDGKRFMGRGEIQTTGRANHRALTKWARAQGIEAPDFEAEPQALEKLEWIGLSTLCYFLTRIEARFLDAGNNEMVTRRVNGGLNGYSDRLRYYDRAALVFLGYGPDQAKQYQQDHGDLAVDGVVGPETRAALHGALKRLKPPAEEQPSLFATLIKALIGIIKGKAQ